MCITPVIDRTIGRGAHDGNEHMRRMKWSPSVIPKQNARNIDPVDLHFDRDRRLRAVAHKFEISHLQGLDHVGQTRNALFPLTEDRFLISA